MRKRTTKATPLDQIIVAIILATALLILKFLLQLVGIDIPLELPE